MHIVVLAFVDVVFRLGFRFPFHFEDTHTHTHTGALIRILPFFVRHRLPSADTEPLALVIVEEKVAENEKKTFSHVVPADDDDVGEAADHLLIPRFSRK